MTDTYDWNEDIDIAWCPGCGNFKIRTTLIELLDEMSIEQRKLVFVSGIGQAAKMPHYIKVNFFNGLHGRSLPVATGIKASNPGLTVIAESGDGCMYGEGGNHFIHAIRRNPDITAIVHNNMVYGLTKGQASPTSRRGFETPLQVGGVILEPFNPLSVAIALNASFVARAFCGDEEKTRDILKQAVQHKGFSLVDVFQNCVSFNRVNNLKWYKDNSYYLGDEHDPSDREKAMSLALKTDKFALGVLYKNSNVPVFEEQLAAYKNNSEPLFTRTVDFKKIQELLDSYA